MVIQGAVMSCLMARLAPKTSTISDGLLVSLAFGLFLVSYIAVVEPSKYMVPSISSWIAVEGIAGLIQFSLFGVLLGFVHKKLG